jgi:hypothetical protein
MKIFKIELILYKIGKIILQSKAKRSEAKQIKAKQNGCNKNRSDEVRCL